MIRAGRPKRFEQRGKSLQCLRIKAALWMILKGKPLNTACPLFYCHTLFRTGHQKKVLLCVFIDLVKLYLICNCFRSLLAEFAEVNGSSFTLFSGLGLRLKERLLLSGCNPAISPPSCLHKSFLDFLLPFPKPSIFIQCQEIKCLQTFIA